MAKLVASKLISDTRPFIFETAVNQFLSSHNISNVSYSTSTSEGLCLFTAFILYVQEAA